MPKLRIREVAEAKNVDKMALSRKSEVAYRTLQLIWKNPDHDVSFNTLKRIAEALEVKVSDLIEDESTPALAHAWTARPALAGT